MKIIDICNQKGGCGKTTTTMNLAGGLARIGYSVAVVDADPQASATVWSLAKGQGGLPFNVFTAHQLGYRFDGVLSLDCSIVLVDCPPGIVDASAKDRSFNFARAAIHEADLLLVPMLPSSLDFSAAKTFARYLGGELPADAKLAILLNGMQRTRLSAQARDLAESIFAPIGGSVLQTTIGRRVSITEVCGLGKTIFDLSLRSSAAQEYTSLAKELLTCLSPAHSSPSTLPTSPASTSTSAPAEPAPLHPAHNETPVEIEIP